MGAKSDGGFRDKFLQPVTSIDVGVSETHAISKHRLTTLTVLVAECESFIKFAVDLVALVGDLEYIVRVRFKKSILSSWRWKPAFSWTRCCFYFLAVPKNEKANSFCCVLQIGWRSLGSRL